MKEVDRNNRISEIEKAMYESNFWNDSIKAQALIKELQDLKDEAKGMGKYDRNSAVFNIVAGAGGDDAEDFAGMLVEMYKKYALKNQYHFMVLDENKNEQNGYRNITFLISCKGTYGDLK